MRVEGSALCFAAGHPAFAGHFPGRPLVPGVLLLDAALHAAAQASIDAGESPAPGCRIASVKFLSPVLPGEALTICCTPTPAGQIRFEISGDGRQVASGSFALGSQA